MCSIVPLESTECHAFEPDGSVWWGRAVQQCGGGGTRGLTMPQPGLNLPYHSRAAQAWIARRQTSAQLLLVRAQEVQGC